MLSLSLWLPLQPIILRFVHSPYSHAVADNHPFFSIAREGTHPLLVYLTSFVHLDAL